eukprot:Pgem_evm1s1596
MENNNQNSSVERKYLSISEMIPELDKSLADKIDKLIPSQHKWYRDITIQQQDGEIDIRVEGKLIKPNIDDLTKRNVKMSVRWQYDNNDIFDAEKWRKLNINALNKVYVLPILNIGSALTDEICIYALKKSHHQASAELLRDDTVIQTLINTFPNSVIPAYALIIMIADLLKVTEKEKRNLTKEIHNAKTFDGRVLPAIWIRNLINKMRLIEYDENKMVELIMSKLPTEAYNAFYKLIADAERNVDSSNDNSKEKYKLELKKMQSIGYLATFFKNWVDRYWRHKIVTDEPIKRNAESDREENKKKPRTNHNKDGKKEKICTICFEDHFWKNCQNKQKIKNLAEKFKEKNPSLFSKDRDNLSCYRCGFGHSVQNCPIKKDIVTQTINNIQDISNSEIMELTEGLLRPIEINNINYNNSLDYVTINYNRLYVPALKDEGSKFNLMNQKVFDQFNKQKKIHLLHEYIPVKGAFINDKTIVLRAAMINIKIHNYEINLKFYIDSTNSIANDIILGIPFKNLFINDNLQKKLLTNNTMEIQYYNKEDLNAQAVICSKNDVWIEPNCVKKFKVKFKNVFFADSLKKEAIFISNKKQRTINKCIDDQIVTIISH